MPKQVNIVVLGDGNVGKSSLTTRYVSNEFIKNYDPTVQDSFRKMENVNGEEITVEILDTAGQEDYVAINDSAIVQGQGFLIVYTITSHTSFEAIDAIIKRIYFLHECETGDKKFPIVICGNKVDLEDKREVPTQEGSEYAVINSASFYESKRQPREHALIYFILFFFFLSFSLSASAKTNVNVTKAFQELLNKCISVAALAPAPEVVNDEQKKKNGCCVIL